MEHAWAWAHAGMSKVAVPEARQRELLKAEHQRAMELVAQEKEAAAALHASAQRKMQQVELQLASLEHKEAQVKRLVEAAEEQVSSKMMHGLNHHRSHGTLTCCRAHMLHAASLFSLNMGI